MTFEDYISKLEKRAQLPQYISSNYENSFNIDESKYTKEYTNASSNTTYWDSESYENANSFVKDSNNSKVYKNADSQSYNAQYHDLETDKGPITDKQSTIETNSQDITTVRNDSTGKYINIKNDFVTDVKTSKLNHSFGMVIDTSELYGLLKEKLEENSVQKDIQDDYTLNENGQKVHSMVTAKNLINNRTIKNVLYSITTYTENKVTNSYIPLRINGKTVDSQFSEKTINGRLHHLYHNFNLEEHNISQRNTDDKSGIFAKTSFNPKNGETGKVDRAKKEKAYKTHLRNYWKINAGSNSSGTAFYGFGNMQTTVDNGYRQRLIDRLAGVSDSDSNKSNSKNFLAGPGVDTETYIENMGVGDLMSLGGLELGSWQNSGGLPQSVLNDVDALRYGTPEKKDLIIDSGRFKANSIKSLDDSNFPEMGPKRRIYALMRSSFGADAMRSPHYRKQMLALGNEVNLLNAFVDGDRVTKTSYRIGFIDEGASGSRSDEPKYTKHAAWVMKNGQKELWSNSSTAIGKLLRRMPDFMGNMYNVYFTIGQLVVGYGDGKANFYDRKNSKNYKNDYIKNEITLEDSLKRYFNPDMFFSSVFAARCTGIQVKLPELKANSMPVLGRKVAYIDSNINFSREGSISIRLDETFDIYKGILSQAGVEYRLEKRQNLLEDAQQENYFINRATPQYNIIDTINNTNNSNRQLDIHIRYDMVNNMVPTDKLENGSFPMGKDGPHVFSPNGEKPYFREFVFTNVKFLGAGDLEFSKDSDVTEMSFPFIYTDIYEVISGHRIENKNSTAT
jgi:hypothetical protein